MVIKHKICNGGVIFYSLTVNFTTFTILQMVMQILGYIFHKIK